jgi:MYXO-CTERM domain-containing protein
MSRSTTPEGVLETIYALAGVKPPPEHEDSVFRGHPLAAAPNGAATIFYGIWPALVVAGAVLARRRLA